MRGKPWPPANMSPMHLASMLQSPTGCHSPNGGSSALAGLFTPEWAKRKLGEGGTPQSAPSGSATGTGGSSKLRAVWRLHSGESLPAECAEKAGKRPFAGMLLGQEPAGGLVHAAKCSSGEEGSASPCLCEGVYLSTLLVSLSHCLSTLWCSSKLWCEAYHSSPLISSTFIMDPVAVRLQGGAPCPAAAWRAQLGATLSRGGSTWSRR